MIKEIQSRHSTRRFQSRDVPQQLIMELLESARLAPSGSNTQPWQFIVVRDTKTRQALTAADHNQQWMLTAPVFIVCVADPAARMDTTGLYIDENSPQPELKQSIRDAAVAIEHILLSAENLGLSTCWTGWYDQKDIRLPVEVPQDKFVLGVICVGYGDENAVSRPRKNLEDIVFFEKWGQKQ